ncbi:MAG: hypothetical protein ACYTGZ_08250 [Planctomycetota bacterium]
MRNAGTFWLVVGALVAFAAAEVGAAPITLYDANFNSDTVGANPATAGGAPIRSGPSSVSEFPDGGSVIVVSSFGSLTDQPVRIRANDLGALSSFGGGNIRFSLSDAGFSGFDSYRFEADILLTDLSGSAGVGAFLDTPIHTIRFENNGDIRVLDPSGSTPIGTYTPGDVFRVRIDVDVLASTWSVSLDGSQVYSAAEASSLAAFRIAHTSPSSSATDVYVDNVLIQANVPEPGLLTLLGAAAGFALLIRRRDA